MRLRSPRTDGSSSPTASWILRADPDGILRAAAHLPGSDIIEIAARGRRQHADPRHGIVVFLSIPPAAADARRSSRRPYACAVHGTQLGRAARRDGADYRHERPTRRPDRFRRHGSCDAARARLPRFRRTRTRIRRDSADHLHRTGDDSEGLFIATNAAILLAPVNSASRSMVRIRSAHSAGRTFLDYRSKPHAAAQWNCNCSSAPIPNPCWLEAFKPSARARTGSPYHRPTATRTPARPRTTHSRRRGRRRPVTFFSAPHCPWQSCRTYSTNGTTHTGRATRITAGASTAQAAQPKGQSMHRHGRGRRGRRRRPPRPVCPANTTAHTSATTHAGAGATFVITA